MTIPLDRPPKRIRQKSQASWPWQFPVTEQADIYAIQAMARGNANEGQQQRAFDYIVRILCETQRMSFWPGGEDGRRASDFAEGKRWVGIQLIRILNMRPEHKDRETD